jgi:hypothetical protein
MKKSKLSLGKSLGDTSIDQYCSSVEALLKNINSKPGKKAPEITSEEPRFLDIDEELFDY